MGFFAIFKQATPGSTTRSTDYQRLQDHQRQLCPSLHLVHIGNRKKLLQLYSPRPSFVARSRTNVWPPISDHLLTIFLVITRLLRLRKFFRVGVGHVSSLCRLYFVTRAVDLNQYSNYRTKHSKSQDRHITSGRSCSTRIR